MKQGRNPAEDDLKATAYALGELPEEEMASADALYRDDHGFRAAVEAIRQMAEHIKRALANEPEPGPQREPGPAPSKGNQDPNDLLRGVMALIGALAAINGLMSQGGMSI